MTHTSESVTDSTRTSRIARQRLAQTWWKQARAEGLDEQ